MTASLVLGAVAYDPKVVTIWQGFRRWFTDRDLPFDFVLYSNYERQVEDLISGHIDAAWNSPLAFVRTRRLAPGARALAMRDTDRDLTSVVVARTESPIHGPADLDGRLVATGAVDSPQGTLLPQALLEGSGAKFRCFDVGTGLHGDHIGGEREAALALARGEVDAACMVDTNHLLFSKEGTLSAGATRVIARTAPYDHCNMTVAGSASPLLDKFAEMLLAMDYADPTVRPLLDLEGLTRWLPGRLSGYAALEAAVDALHFYGAEGEITSDDYDP